MENLPLLDIIIGLSLIYTCASLLASELTKFVITASRWRTKCLTQCLLTLLGESSSRDNPAMFKRTITDKLLNSSYIVAATQSAHRQTRSLFLSRVSPRLWAEALLDVLQRLPQPPTSPDQQHAVLSPIAQLQSIVVASPDLPLLLRTNLMRVIRRVQSLECNPEQQMERLKSEIGVWFRYAMVEATNTYKYHFKLISFLVSFGLTVTMNIDSLYIIRRISENTATRAVITQNVTHIQGCQRNLSSLQCTERLSRLMESTTIPVGWQPSNRRKQFAQLNPVILVRTMGGWFLSSIAIAMGSRFWLHLLNQLVVVLGRRRRKPQRGSQPILAERDRRASSFQSIELQEQ